MNIYVWKILRSYTNLLAKYIDQQQCKAIIEAAIIYTPEIFTDNGPMSPSQSVTVRNPSAIKSLRQFLDTLEVKPKTYFRRFVPLNQSAKQSELAVCCGPVYQSDLAIQKSTSRSKKLFKIRFYNILRFWCLQ